MLRLRLSSRPRRPVAYPRTRLSLETLDGRAVPSPLGTDGTLDALAQSAMLGYAATYPTSSPTPGEEGPVVPADAPPEIVDFAAERLTTGLYELSGRVIDEQPSGLLVQFGGIESAEGKTATTDSEGYFSLTLMLKSDGSDSGQVTAVTHDAIGQESNTAAYYVNPA